MSVASLVLGILGVLTCGSFSIGAFILNLLAIIFGAIGKGKERPKMGKAGLILGIIGMAIVIMGVITNPLASQFVNSVSRAK